MSTPVLYIRGAHGLSQLNSLPLLKFTRLLHNSTAHARKNYFFAEDQSLLHGALKWDNLERKA